LYPNPANDVLFVRSQYLTPYDYNFHVVDMNGRIIKEGKVPGGNSLFEIDINSLPPSVYLLKLYNTNGVVNELIFIKMGD
jgi:hypothetical protein